MPSSTVEIQKSIQSKSLPALKTYLLWFLVYYTAKVTKNFNLFFAKETFFENWIFNFLFWCASFSTYQTVYLEKGKICFHLIDYWTLRQIIVVVLFFLADCSHEAVIVDRCLNLILFDTCSIVKWGNNGTIWWNIAFFSTEMDKYKGYTSKTLSMWPQTPENSSFWSLDNSLMIKTWFYASSFYHLKWGKTGWIFLRQCPILPHSLPKQEG